MPNRTCWLLRWAHWRHHAYTASVYEAEYCSTPGPVGTSALVPTALLSCRDDEKGDRAAQHGA
eukprot:5884056-Amphidinium_carterae.1